MISALHDVAAQWLQLATLGTLQSSLFLGFVFLLLHLCRRRPAGFLRLLVLVGVAKLLVPPVLRFASAPQPVRAPLEDVVVRFTPGAVVETGSSPWPLALFLVWACSVVFLLGLSVARTWRLQRRLARAQRIDVRGYLHAHEMRRDVQFFEKDTDGSPMVIGLWRHRVLLPSSWRTWTPDCVRSVLLHEMAHVRRGDHWVQAAQTLALALHFFNPLAWWLHRRLAQYTELACDDATIARAHLDPADYARHLLRVAEDIARTPMLVPARMAIPDPGGSLRQRFRYVLGSVNGPRRLGLRAGAVLVVVGAAIVPLSAHLEVVQSAPPSLTETVRAFRSKAVVGREERPDEATASFVFARPLQGFAVLGKYLQCPCTVDDHSVCPRGRIVYGESVRRRGIVVAVLVDDHGRVVSANVIRDPRSGPGWNADNVLDAVWDSAWAPGRRADEPVASRLEIAFHGGQF